ncbi:MAG TPA: DUF4175 family protein, partial [Methanomicrobiales archaeon]|nr:DUF4175 family protein [Methanomicrobiales archaeon]
MLTPPDYTGLPKEEREDGQIEAIKGTFVNVEAQSTKGVREGKLFLNQESQVILDIKGKQLRGSLLVLHPGSYSIRVKDEFGFENPNPVAYPIRLIPDKYPEGEILSPAQDLEISGTEVISIVYAARDDFGVTSVSLGYQVGGKERRINLKSPGGSRSVEPETFKWDLASLDLMPGDRVIYRLEIEDNDSVSGPKVAYSRSFTLSMRDERSRAVKEGEDAQQIADALLDLLADQLEETQAREPLAQRMEEILNRVDRNLKETDKADRFDLEALRRNLASLKERMPKESKETVTQEMERLALLAEDISKKARMKEVEALAREIRNRQRRLLDAMQEFKGPLTKEAQEAFMKELRKLEELLHSVMDALSKMASRLPEEFINNQDLSGLEFQDMFKDLEEIQKKLMAGDLAGALEAAQRLLQALSEMMAALSRAGAQAGMSPMDRLQGEMSRQSGELDKILAEQKEILKETEKIEGALRQRVEEETEKRLNQSLPELEELLKRLNRSLSAEQKELVEGLEELL